MSTEENKDRRLAERVPSRFLVNYVHQGDYLISHSRDLSVDGMFLHTENPPALGETTTLEFEIGKGQGIQLDAKVVWVNKDVKNNDAGMAVRFIRPSVEIKAKLASYIRKIALLNN